MRELQTRTGVVRPVTSWCRLVSEQAGQRLNVSAEAEHVKPGHAPFQCQVQTLSVLRGVLQYHTDFSCKVQAAFTMGDFATVGQLEAFLYKLNANYTKGAAGGARSNR
ncbi:hypothetical protein WJX77_005069 [Trebouxia sp. C0004]